VTAAERLKNEYLTKAEIAEILEITLKTLDNRRSADPANYPPIDSDGLCHVDAFKDWQKKRASRGMGRR
jgi:hypothetical protein